MRRAQGLLEGGTLLVWRVYPQENYFLPGFVLVTRLDDYLETL